MGQELQFSREWRRGWKGKIARYISKLFNCFTKRVKQASNPIAVDCNVVLRENEEQVDAMIDILKAKELAQAELAKMERALNNKKNIEIEVVSVRDTRGTY